MILGERKKQGRFSMGQFAITSTLSSEARCPQREGGQAGAPG